MNRLSGETSPYLLQHARNPVDWYPWGPEALDRAARENKPIFLSIGYAACHWCHVMERESFENEHTARFLNEHFVCIKVDREERPDLDDIYMAATVAISGSGGWPMSVFLLPDQRPFFAGTYFPPSDRYGRPGFPTLIARIAELFEGERDKLFAEATALTNRVKAQAELPEASPIPASVIVDAVRTLRSGFDEVWGGFGPAPKFPAAQTLSLLLAHHARTGDAGALEMAQVTLAGMKNGGLYDQLGGGFARYSTDERWLVPHFEKMLYDNAALVPVYLEAFQLTGDPEYRRVADETLAYVVREMQSKEGGYYSATDADSEGVEGKYFVFTLDEVQSHLTREEAEYFAFFYDVTPEGNWEGTNVLNTPRTLAQAADVLGVAVPELERTLASARTKLLEVRSQRVPPLLDDKIITAWNGLMIAAMAEGARVLAERKYLESAERAARHALTALRRADGRLYRTARNGDARLDAYLEDYAYLADGLVTLFEAGADPEFLNAALELAETLLRDFGDDPEGGAFFYTAKGHEQLIARTREGHDGALANPNAIAARALVRLGRHFDRPELAERATRALEAYGSSIARLPRAFASSLNVLAMLSEPAVELCITGVAGTPEREAIERAAARVFLANRVIAHVDPTRENPNLPLTRDKGLVAGRAALYVCRNYACEAPITDPASVAAALSSPTPPGASS
jgi:uncharacterized protein YyaL (SSP411 family)